MSSYRANHSPFDSGSLDRPIKFYCTETSRDARRSVIDTEVLVGEDRAMIEYRSTDEVGTDFKNELAVNEVLFTVRYRSDIRSGWIIHMDGQRYTIEGLPTEIGRRMGLKIKARFIEK